MITVQSNSQLPMVFSELAVASPLFRFLCRFRELLCVVVACMLCSPFVAFAGVSAPNTDQIVFGDQNSESAHGLLTQFGAVWAGASTLPIPSDPSATPPSDVIVGALGQSARRLLPRTPNGDYYGGEVVFSIGVDPVKENNFTLKIWGEDLSDKSWLILNIRASSGEFLEIGGRHMLKDESILQNSSGWLPGRFIYRTVRLPKHLTAGKTSVTLRIRSVGVMSYYAPPPYDNFQKRMVGPSVALYRAYSHVGPLPDLTGEMLGVAPQFSVGNTAPAAESAWLAAWKAQVSSMIASRIKAPASSLTADDIDFLAQAYRVNWTPAYGNSAVVDQIVGAMDSMVSAYSAAPSSYFSGKFPDGGNVGWGGYLGVAGRAIKLVWPQLENRMGEPVGYGGVIGTASRGAAWGVALRASVDYGRMNRRTIGNQAIDAAIRTYWANSALLLVSPGSALYEAEARRYLHEAFGLSPWMGNDKAGSGPVPTRGDMPFGPNFYMVTAKGTTREDCFVGGDYGEMGASAFRVGRMIDDAKLVDQGIKMLRARAGLRYPAVDSSGSLVSVVVNPIGCRNDHEVNRHKVYLARDLDTVLVAAAGAEVIGADLLGYAQQQFNEGKLLSEMSVGGGNWYKGAAGWYQIASVPDAYNAFRSHPATGYKLPMSVGGRDFAWVDEDNMVVAAKRGEERFFANLHWRGPDAINRLARVFLTTPHAGFLADVSVDDLKYRPSGNSWLTSKWVEATPVPGGFNPPDNPVNANIGLRVYSALRPDLTEVPKAWNRDGGRGFAYTLQYGNWFVAINSHPVDGYQVPMPSGFISGVDMVSGAIKQRGFVLGAKSSAVFYLPGVSAGVYGGTYKVVASHSGRALTAISSSSPVGSYVGQDGYEALVGQKWAVENGPNGFYKLKVGGQFLGVADGVLRSGSQVVLGVASGSDAQLWAVAQDIVSGTCKICAKLNANLCLTVSGASMRDEAVVTLFPWRAYRHQRWSFGTP